MRRRLFLATLGAALGFFGFQKYLSAAPSNRVISPYGPFLAGPYGILDLPKAFSYQIIFGRGSRMDDGKLQSLGVKGKPAANLLTSSDNLCGATWGNFIICENLVAENQGNIPHLRGITPGGKIYLVAENSRSVSEFVISCFPPDGSVLVKKIQGEGLTLAFNGSWNTRA
ncbi:MAG: hypothetical protein ABF381_03300 [Akkermansiaceae bacterium]